MAERLLISVWLTREHRNSHSLRRIRRDCIKHMLVPFVKAPAINDQTLADRWQDFLVHVRQVVTPANRGDFLLCWFLR